MSDSNDRARVAWIAGSDSDLPHLEKGLALLKEFGVPFEMRILSAHRTPDDVADFVDGAYDGGVRVFIAAAGMAAHLAGAVAARTTLPVIGVPMPATNLQGLDALLSTVQMPGGIPVATMAIGSAGAVNAALFAMEILALADPDLSGKLKAHREAAADKVRSKDEAVRARFQTD